MDRLADELAARMGHHDKSQAVREALRAQLSLLAIGDGFPQTDLEFGEGIVGYWPTPHDPDTRPVARE